MSQHIGELEPGWYPDPEGEPKERYWDGRGWTDRTRPMVISIRPRTPPPADGVEPSD